MRRPWRRYSAVLICLICIQPVMGRDAAGTVQTAQLAGSGDPAYCIAAHRIGRISLSVNNNANLGSGFPAGGSSLDCFTGEVVPSCEYPMGSDVEHLFAASLWIGAIIGSDTVVSTGADGWSRIGGEYRPEESPWGDMIYRSTLYPEDPELYADAVSEEDYIATYTDSFPYDDPYGGWMGEQHVPLDIEVTQSSYAWSYSHTEDFIIIDYRVKNVGSQVLEDVCAGLWVDGDVGHLSQGYYHTDDIAGFAGSYLNSAFGPDCQYTDTINLAWIADNDGDPSGGVFADQSCPHVTGVSFLYIPSAGFPYPRYATFNWWVSSSDVAEDFGPRERDGAGEWPEDFRDFGTGGLGTPEGDHNKYYQLRNQEVDYDQAFTGVISDDDPTWMYPNQESADDIANGNDTKYLLSFGPVGDLNPGQSMPFCVAYVAGENLHLDALNINNLLDNPEQYYANLGFSDLFANATMASWVYDNPGVDTDGDGWSGSMKVCGDDSIWIQGDYIPDFKPIFPVPVAPPWPRVWIDWPNGDTLMVRWNGLRSETALGFAGFASDFEGYNVYLSTDGSPGSFMLIGSYDREDYLKYVWDDNQAEWVIHDRPLTLEELRCLYGASCDDATFDPLDYPSNSPYVAGDSIFYFAAYGNNTSEFGVTTPVIKTYPAQPYPSSLDPNQADPSELTDDGYFKYFEYHLKDPDLNPAMCYYVSVTAFDYGWPPSGTPALESDIEGNAELICFTDVAEDQVGLPKAYALLQNHPNPFNATTEISLALPAASHVRLEIFNIVGQRVATLVDGRLKAGHHTFSWDGGDASTGVYIYRLQAGDFTETRKMVLLK
ncbi:MAG: T9SS type A sorting domain-containing protein [Candidatus Zixiibacteriota bacterium]|nr:MAG: T9SS type A sorting domain-containing protein [candidate division Zixibacteria bacterium]